MRPERSKRWPTPTRCAAAFGEWAGEALPIQYEAEVIASGETGVTLAQSITRGGDSFQQAFLVAEGEDGWKTLAVTAVS